MVILTAVLQRPSGRRWRKMKMVREGFALYLTKRALAESSVEVKKRALELFIESAAPAVSVETNAGVHRELDMPVESVGFCEVEDFKMWLAKTKSKASANIYLANLKPFFGWLEKRGIIKQDPFAAITFFETDSRRKEIFTPAEIERIMQVASLRWQVITLLGLCSLRRSEVLNLTKNDLNWQGGYLRITPKQQTANTWAWTIKNHRAAIVPMPEIFTLPDMIVNLHQRIRELIAETPYGQQYICVQPEVCSRMLKMQTEGKLCWHWRNCPWQNFTRDWLRLLKRAAVTPKRYHDLRATMPTTMAERGVPITDVQRLMRHKSVQTTARYYIATDESKLVKTTTDIALKYYVTNVS
jgi:integrase